MWLFCRLRAQSIPVGIQGLKSRVCQPVGRERASSLGSGGGWTRQLPPHAFSRRDFTAMGGGSTAKGQALLTPAAPGSLAGVLVIQAAAGDGVCLGVPVSRGDGELGEPALLGCCQGKGRGMEGRKDGWRSFWAHSPPSPSSLLPGEGAEGSGEARCAPGISS